MDELPVTRTEAYREFMAAQDADWAAIDAAEAAADAAWVRQVREEYAAEDGDGLA